MACQTCGQPTYYPLILSSTADGECIITEYPLSCDCDCPHVVHPIDRNLFPPPGALPPWPPPSIITGMPHWNGGPPGGGGINVGSTQWGNLPSENYIVTSLPTTGTLFGAGLYPSHNMNSDGYYLQGGISETSAGVSATSGIASILVANDQSIMAHVGPSEVVTSQSDLSTFGKINLGLTSHKGVTRPAATLTVNASGIHAFTNKTHSGGGLANELFRINTDDKGVYSYGPVTSAKHVATKEYVDGIVGGHPLTSVTGVSDYTEPLDVPEGVVAFWGPSIQTSASVMGSQGYSLKIEIKNGGINQGYMGSDSIGTAQLRSGEVTNAKLSTDAVTSDKLSASSVTNSKIASGIDASKIGANTNVSNTEYGYLDGVTSNIQTQFAGKLSSAAGAVGEANLADDSVTKAKVASDVAGVGLRQSAGGELDVKADGTSIYFDDTLSLTVVDGSIDSAKITSLGVATSNIAASAVNDSKVASGINASKIGDGSVSNSEYQCLSAVTSDIQNQINGKISLSIVDSKGDLIVGNGADAIAKLPAGLDNQVLTTSSGDTYGLGWKYPLIPITLSFATTVAIAAGATSVGLVDRISNLAVVKVPTGKTFYIVSVWGHSYTGATAGTYTVEFIAYNRTDFVSTALASGTAAAATNIHGYAAGTLAAPLASFVAGKEVQIGIKNTHATLALGTTHDIFVTGYLI